MYGSPAYPVYERGAAFAGGVPTPIPLREANGFLPDLDAVPASVWDETAILWLNYPHNPTGAVAPPSLYARALELAARHGFCVASDEAYGELSFGGAPPVSLLAAGTDRALVFQTLSKRSAMTGFRSGFVAGDPQLIATFRELRPEPGRRHARVRAGRRRGGVERRGPRGRTARRFRGQAGRGPRFLRRGARGDGLPRAAE